MPCSSSTVQTEQIVQSYSCSTMSRVCMRVLVQVLVLLVLPVLLLLSSGSDSLKTRREVRDNQPLKNDILEMLHINKMSVRHQNKAHPYMKRVYQSLDGMQDFGQSEGMLVQSLRSVDGPRGWIWFSLRDLQPPVQRAELVLFRRSLHLGPLSISVTLHGLSASTGNVSEAPPLEERSGGTMSETPPRSRGTMSEAPSLEKRLLALNRRPSSGFDVFDVSAWVGGGQTELVGFQLRYTDDRGSLVLHEALTQSLYSLNRGSVTEPLLVLYQSSFTTTSIGL